MVTCRICQRSRSHNRMTRETSVETGGIARAHGAKSLIPLRGGSFERWRKE